MRSDDFRLSMPIPAAIPHPSLPIRVTIFQDFLALLSALYSTAIDRQRASNGRYTPFRIKCADGGCRNTTCSTTWSKILQIRVRFQVGICIEGHGRKTIQIRPQRVGFKLRNSPTGFLWSLGMHTAVAQGPKASSVLVDISASSGNFLCPSRYDNAFFYFLHQLVHSLSRFLSIFQKLVLSVVTTVASLKQCTMPNSKLSSTRLSIRGAWTRSRSP